MHQSPSIVPETLDRDIYLVLEDFGAKLGCAWRETDEADTERPTLIRHLLEGQYDNPVRIIAFNTAEGWSRDVSQEVADELAQRIAAQELESPSDLQDFIDQHGSGRPLRGTA